MECRDVHPKVYAVVESVLTRHRRSIVSLLLGGACSVLHPSTLQPASSLLYAVLRLSPFEEAEMCYEAALGQEPFAVLDHRYTSGIATYLRRCAHGELGEVAMAVLFDGIWQLFQVKEVETIAHSDQLVSLMVTLNSMDV